MAKRAGGEKSAGNESSINALDVALLDLFAETEAILRCGREIQRSIVTLRGGDGALSATKRGAVISKIQLAASAMHERCNEMVSRAVDLAHAANDVD